MSPKGCCRLLEFQVCWQLIPRLSKTPRFLFTRRKQFSIIPSACRQDRRQLLKHSFAWGGS